MRRKALQGIANTLCHMVDGEARIFDEKRLAELGTGTLVIDALAGSATHDGAPVSPPLHLAAHMRRWLMEELGRLRLSPGDLVAATVTVPYEVFADTLDGMRLWDLVCTCRSEVVTDEATYVGSPIPGRPRFGGAFPA